MKKPLRGRNHVPHRSRDEHAPTHPMHITARAVAGLPSFRTPQISSLVLSQMRRLNDEDFQIVHFSVQSNHLHLIVEAHDGDAVSRKMTGFLTSFAKRLNKHLGRKGQVWRERFYCRDITDAREMHNVLTYVFGNAKKHGAMPASPPVLDPFSSAWTFDGFGFDPPLPPERARWRPPKPRTALLENEWVVYGFVPI